MKNSDEYGHFVVDPKRVKNLNSQQRIAAQRIYGPDEDSFEQNMAMFVESLILPKVFVLMPEYVQDTLRRSDNHYLGLASWLGYFYFDSNFCADILNHI